MSNVGPALALLAVGLIAFFFAASRFAYGRDEDWVFDPLSLRRLLRWLPLKAARALLAAYGVLALAGALFLLLQPT